MTARARGAARAARTAAGSKGSAIRAAASPRARPALVPVGPQRLIAAEKLRPDRPPRSSGDSACATGPRPRSRSRQGPPPGPPRTAIPITSPSTMRFSSKDGIRSPAPAAQSGLFRRCGHLIPPAKLRGSVASSATETRSAPAGPKPIPPSPWAARPRSRSPRHRLSAVRPARASRQVPPASRPAARAAALAGAPAAAGNLAQRILQDAGHQVGRRGGRARPGRHQRLRRAVPRPCP